MQSCAGDDDLRDEPVPLQQYGKRLVYSAICSLLYLSSPGIYAAEPLTIDDLGFNSITNNNLFSSRYTLENEAEVKGLDKTSVRTLLDVEEIDDNQYGVSSLDNLDYLTSSYRSQGLKINRLSTTWETGGGTLTVGNDWTNFQDFLQTPDSGPGYSSLLYKKQTAKQVTWTSRNGFSIALEEPNTSELDAIDSNIESLQGLTDGSSNLVLSWQGGPGGKVGQYKLSALGRKLDVNGVHSGVLVDDSQVGWGLNLAGGWRFGDLFAALSLTLGNGIDSLLMNRFGSDVAVETSGQANTLGSISVLPSLSYSINKSSNFHVALGHYQAEDGDAIAGVDTLDTINLGYTWSPWPSTNFGVEVVGKDFEGTINNGDSAEVKFGAQTRF